MVAVVSMGLLGGAPEGHAAVNEEEPWTFADAHPDDCPDLLVVGARGSGQSSSDDDSGGLGPQVAEYYDVIAEEFAALGASTRYYSLPYPAIPYEDYLTGDPNIFEAVDVGMTSVRVVMSAVSTTCDDQTKVALVGFSQGAWAVKLGLGHMREQERHLLAGAVLIGDPTFDPSGGGRTTGGYDALRDGVAGAITVPTHAHDRTLSVCLYGDLVCQGGRIDESGEDDFSFAEVVAMLAVGGLPIHTYGYLSDDAFTHRSPYPLMAAGLLAQQLGLTDEESGSSAASVGASLIIDSSGSMSWEDPQDLRKDGAKAYVTASTARDRVGVIDFDSSVTIRHEPANPVTDRQSLFDAIDAIDSSGGTNLGAGVQAGCDMLRSSGEQDAKTGLFLTDGRGSYADQASCFVDEGWPLFTFGLGDGTDEDLLAAMAEQTGGTFVKLDDATSMVCEFQRVRSLASGLEPDACERAGTILEGEILTFVQEVVEALAQVTFTISWPGSDIELELVSPSGRTIDRSTVASDVRRETGATYDAVTIQRPEAGDWTLRLVGHETDEEGTPFYMQQTAVPSSNEPPTAAFQLSVDGSDITVDATDSYDPDGELISYQWSFGDGTAAQGLTAEHTYAESGSYEVALTVIDASFETARHVITVVIEAATVPTSRADCQGGGHETYGFRNQGQCIQYFNTGRDHR